MWAPKGGLAAIGSSFGKGVPVKPDGRSRIAAAGLNSTATSLPRAHLPQGGHIVHDPEATAMGCDHKIVAMHVDIAHGGDRQILLQRLPVRAIVERHEHAALRAGIKQAAAEGSSRTTLMKASSRNAPIDARPAPAAIVRAIYIGGVIVETVAIDREISRVEIEMRQLDAGDLRPRRQRRRRDVLPVRALIVRAPDKAIVSADPERAGGERRRRDRIDHAAALAHMVIVGGGRCIEVRRDPASARVRSGLIGAQCSPPSAVRNRRWLAK